MRAPYIERPEEAFLLAEVGLGLVLGAVVAFRPPRRLASAALLLVAAWIAVLAPIWASTWGVTSAAAGGIGWWLGWSRLALLAALLVHGRLRSAVVALPAIALAWWLAGWLRDSDLEACAFHLQVAAWTYGAMWERSRTLTAPSAFVAQRRDALWPSLVCIALGTLAGVWVARSVLDFKTDSSDEWAYTYQAYLFAKGHAYGAMFPCSESLRPFWVIYKEGRLFAQYQPGWPIFMVPFVWVGCVWLAGPVSFGFLLAAFRRLARAVVQCVPGTSADEARRAGIVAVVLTLGSGVLLLNAGSRYPHLWVLACFAFALEQCLHLAYDDARDRTLDTWRGLAAGFAIGWLFCTRVPDAVMMGSGPGLLLLVQVLRRRVSWKALAAAAAALLGWTFVLYGISRLQLGHWGQLTYQYGVEFYPWNKLVLSLPPPHQLKWHVSTMWGAYCYWPLSPAIGAAGLAWAFAHSRRTVGVATTVGASTLATLTLYTLIEYGRGNDFGYGPRYQFVVLVPTVLGTALLYLAVCRRLTPAVRMAFTGVVGVVALGLAVGTTSHVLSSSYRLLQQVGKIERTVERARLKNAVVVMQKGTHTYGEQDLHNVPVELYSPRVIYANESDVQCLRDAFPTRAFYKASPKTKTEVNLERMP